MSTYYLGIDSGTQSTKAIVLDFETGKILSSAQRKYELIEGLSSGHLEQHPQDWLDAVGARNGEARRRRGGRGVGGRRDQAE